MPIPRLFQLDLRFLSKIYKAFTRTEFLNFICILNKKIQSEYSALTVIRLDILYAFVNIILRKLEC